MSTTTISTTTALMLSSETGLFLSFFTIIFLISFVIAIYFFWPLKQKNSLYN